MTKEYKEKSRSFSIYLLKQDKKPETSLKNNESLTKCSADEANFLPDGAILYILDREPTEPWWKEYWGITKELPQTLKGAIVFLPVKLKQDDVELERFFVLTYGHTYHYLHDDAYEYDFGLRTTLNTLDPDKIKSTDILSPENAKWERIQSSVNASWTFFDFHQDESIVKKLHGAVKKEYGEIFKNVTGSASFKFNSSKQPHELKELCSKLWNIYQSNAYETSFPDLQGIVPVKDPSLILELNNKLIEGFHEKSDKLFLTIPSIINSEKSYAYYYSGLGKNEKEYDNINIDDYFQYVNDKGRRIISDKNISQQQITWKKLASKIDVNLLKSHQLNLKTEDGSVINSFSIYKCILFDCEFEQAHYHLCDGLWYKIETDFIVKLKSILDPIFVTNPYLLDCQWKDEGEYNQEVSKHNKWECLDTKNIAPAKSKQVEPCDMLSCLNNTVQFYHLKISNKSSSLSHLFNQGLNSIELIRSENEAKANLKRLIPTDMHTIIDNGDYEIIYGIIINPKRVTEKSDALPLFSKISLMRTLRLCQLWNIKCSVVLIKDLYPRK